MGSVGSATGITFAGLSSGIDTDSIVKRLIELESLPIQRMQKKQEALEGKMAIYNQLRAQLQSLSSAASSLTVAGALNSTKSSSTKTDVATISSSGNSIESTYSLSVYQLAQAEKLSSVAQTSVEDALGFLGTFSINDVSIEVATTDSLSSIASKINSANAGVTASIINGGAGQAYITLTSKTSGLANKISIEDTAGSVMADLGFLATSLRNTVTNGAQSQSVNSTSATLDELFGMGSTSIEVTIDGQNLTIDPSSDTLTSLRDKINALGGDATASIVSQVENGRTTYRLQIEGSSSTPSLGSEGQAFLKMGFFQRSSELVGAQDALFTLDNVALSSSKNEVTSVIPGATLTLLKANGTTPETSVLEIKKNTDVAKNLVKNFMSAYNATVGYIQENSKLDPETFKTGPLFGDSIAAQVDNELASMLFSRVEGLTGDYRSLVDIGFSLAEGGTLQLDEAKLDAALANDSESVNAIFRSTGKSANSELSYVSSSSKSFRSGAGGYAVEITQAASQASVTAALAQAGASTAYETLTFNGNLFGNTEYSIGIPINSTLSATISIINSDSRLKDLVVATNDGGKLKLTSKRYGESGNFSVESSLALDPIDQKNSGIGGTGESTSVAGLDVAGTINGETATGNGQFLTGNSGNSTTDGLQIMYSGSTLGSVGQLVFTKGLANMFVDSVQTFVTANTGLLSGSDKAIQDEYDDLASQIADLQARSVIREQQLRKKFAAMEEAIAKAQSQGQRLAGMLNTKSS